MPTLFLSNIPYDCHDAELRQWIEVHGFQVQSVRIVRDLVAGVSPSFGYIEVRDFDKDTDAIQFLNGQNLRGRTIQVKEDWRAKRVGNF